MGTPYVEEPANQFHYTTDWQEIIDSASQPSNSHISNDVQEATLVGYVPWNKQRDCARYFLGFAFTETVPPYRLFRENPLPHPVFPWLYAADVSFSPYLIKNNPDYNQPNVPSVFPFHPPQYTTYCEKVIATVRYRNYRQFFLEDDEITTPSDEWMRNVVIDIEPSVEALQCTGGLSQLTFAEPAVPAANQPQGGVNKFPAPLAALLSKVGFTLNWYNVPYDYLSSNTDYFFPTKILACVGTVNSTTFLGDLPAGTVLMKSPRFIQKPFPVAADNFLFPLMAVDVQLSFEYFNPKKGPGTGGALGHNLMPWSGDGTLAKPGGDGLFYLCTRDGTLGGTRLIAETDHTSIFTNVRAP